ncbi:MAG: hypothetical protein ABFR53_09735 [Actinomycetota bacterium]
MTVPRQPGSSPPSNVLLLSHPRSGSSWLGSTMANSPIVDYRREPVLQHRIGKVSDAFGASSGLTPEERDDLQTEVTAAFADRESPTVVVKEVTPLLVDDFLQAADPQVVYLRRHPLAVAESHLALGWLPHRRLLDRAGIGAREREMLQSLWDSGSDAAKLVAYFAAVESSVRDRLERAGAITVTYEDLRAGDIGDAARLFDSLGIGTSDLSAPSVDGERTDAYGVGESRKLTSVDVPTPEALEEVKEAWLAFSPTSYRNEADWTLGTA